MRARYNKKKREEINKMAGGIQERHSVRDGEGGGCWRPAVTSEKIFILCELVDSFCFYITVVVVREVREVQGQRSCT